MKGTELGTLFKKYGIIEKGAASEESSTIFGFSPPEPEPQKRWEKPPYLHKFYYCPTYQVTERDRGEMESTCLLEELYFYLLFLNRIEIQSYPRIEAASEYINSPYLEYPIIKETLGFFGGLRKTVRGINLPYLSRIDKYLEDKEVILFRRVDWRIDSHTTFESNGVIWSLRGRLFFVSKRKEG